MITVVGFARAADENSFYQLMFAATCSAIMSGAAEALSEKDLNVAFVNLLRRLAA